MRRREFIWAAGGAMVSSLSWPLPVRAQRAAPGKWRIGLLMQAPRQEILRQGLRELGYVEGENMTIETRSNDRADRLDAFAAELVSSKPDLIAIVGTQAAKAVQQATKTIPIVLAGTSDPVRAGLVASLARPGGNTTGLSNITPELGGKRLELLREFIGGMSSAAVFWNPQVSPAVIELKETQAAAAAIGVQLVAVEAATVEGFAPAFAKIEALRPEALVILTAPLMNIEAARIGAFARAARLPSIYSDAAFPKAGGLMSYGPNFDLTTKRAAIYIDKIFKGASPADLPVEQPTKIDFILNLKTANALGLEVPPMVLARADEVIE